MKLCRNHLGQSSVFRTGSIPRALALFALLVAGSAAGLADSWSAVNTGLPVTDVRTLVTDPVNPASVYVGGVGGLFKSVDGGANWSVTAPLPNQIRSLLIDFKNPNILYAETQNPNGCGHSDQLVFKSADGGAGWSSISPPDSGCLLGALSYPPAIAMDPANPNVIYIAEADDVDGIYMLSKSTDGGAHWTSTWQFNILNLTFDPTNHNTLYAGTDDDFVFYPSSSGATLLKSVDGGTTWSPIGLWNASVTTFAIDPGNPSILYAGTEGYFSDPKGFRGLFKSIDGGVTWSTINTGLESLVGSGLRLTALVIDPSNSSILYAGTSGSGVFKSSDGGASWFPFNDSLGNLDVRVLTFAHGGTGVLYAGTGGGVFKVTPSPTCSVVLSGGGQVFPATGGSGALTITAPQGCAWSVSGTHSGVTFTSPTSGTGNGTITYQVAPAAGTVGSATITIAGVPFTIEQQPPSIPGLSLAGSMPHIAAEENWGTAFTLVNKSANSIQTRLNLFNDAAGPLTLPLTFPQQPSTGSILAASIDRPLAAHASLIIDANGPRTIPVQTGSAQLAATGSVDGFAILHLLPGAQEAAVPLETRNASSYLLAYDQTEGMVLGVALANVSAQPANVAVVIRDDSGVQIGSDVLPSLAGGGHTSFVLSVQFPVTASKRGTIEFDTPAGGQISVVGIRMTPWGASYTLTTIPPLANVGTAGGTIAHIATGNGWQTTFVIVNMGATAAQAHLQFFGDNGTPLSVPVGYPQSGEDTTSLAASVDRTIAAGATLIVRSAAPATDLAPTIGSAQLTTSGDVRGYVIYRYNPDGQEAAAPFENRNAGSYLLAFDNTAGTTTGVALNVVATQPVNIAVVVRDDTGAQIATGSLNLAANGHLAFTLATDKYPVTANRRGTIEFDAPAGVQIGVLGIRIPIAHTFTSLPALAN